MLVLPVKGIDCVAKIDYNEHMRKRKNQEKSVSIRMDEMMLEEIRALAQGNERSINGEVIIAIRKHLNEAKKRKKGEKEDVKMEEKDE